MRGLHRCTPCVVCGSVSSLVLVVSFGVLGWVGSRIYQLAPPIPERVVDERRPRRVRTGRGRRRPGRLAVARRHGARLDLGPRRVRRAGLDRRLAAPRADRRARRVGDAGGRRRRTPRSLREAAGRAARAAATRVPHQHLRRRDGHHHRVAGARRARSRPTSPTTRSCSPTAASEYALPRRSIIEPERARALSAFFFWSAWAAATDRPGDTITYTSNWPHEPLIGNVPTPGRDRVDGRQHPRAARRASARSRSGTPRGARTIRRRRCRSAIRCSAPRRRRRSSPRSSTSGSSARWSCCRSSSGIITAHYGVEGTAFYGIPLAKVLPYAVARTWHVQLGIFWIATAWLAAGLAIAPSVGARAARPEAARRTCCSARSLVVVARLARRASSSR